MKRLFILAAIILSYASTSLASDYAVLAKLNNQTTLDGIARYLGADDEQKRDLEFIFNESAKKYKKATNEGTDATKASNKALYFNLANAKHVLSPEQYKKYVMVLNITISNAQGETFVAEK